MINGWVWSMWIWIQRKKRNPKTTSDTNKTCLLWNNDTIPPPPLDVLEMRAETFIVKKTRGKINHSLYGENETLKSIEVYHVDMYPVMTVPAKC